MTGRTTLAAVRTGTHLTDPTIMPPATTMTWQKWRQRQSKKHHITYAFLYTRSIFSLALEFPNETMILVALQINMFALSDGAADAAPGQRLT